MTDVTGMNNICIEIDEIMNEWNGNGMVIDVVDEKDKVMKRHKNWDFGMKIVDNHNKN